MTAVYHSEKCWDLDGISLTWTWSRSSAGWDTDGSHMLALPGAPSIWEPPRPWGREAPVKFPLPPGRFGSRGVFDRNADEATPFRPRPVVVADVGIPQQVLEREPGVR